MVCHSLLAGFGPQVSFIFLSVAGTSCLGTGLETGVGYGWLDSGLVTGIRYWRLGSGLGTAVSCEWLGSGLETTEGFLRCWASYGVLIP